MQDAPLQGCAIVVTRPEAQAEGLGARIRAAGGVPVPFPLLTIAPLEATAGLDEIVAALAGQHMAFFVSPNAVRYGLALVRARRPWPAGVAVATVGEGSERALREAGFETVIAPRQGFDSEAVLALEAFSATAVAGRGIVIFRGDGGRDLLGQTLSSRGARVTYFTCYRRACPEVDVRPLLARAANGQLHALTLTSSEGVRNLAALAGPDGMACLREVPAFACHERIAAAARSIGLLEVIETAPGDEGLFRALLAWRAACA